MRADDLLRELCKAGIRLSLGDNGHLVVELAPEYHTLPWPAAEQIEQHRQALIAVLGVRPLPAAVLRRMKAVNRAGGDPYDLAGTG
ncbi:MAG: hypothetical protein ACYDCJ_00910 [Gammaproteobacteria bacterium]